MHRCVKPFMIPADGGDAFSERVSIARWFRGLLVLAQQRVSMDVVTPQALTVKTRCYQNNNLPFFFTQKFCGIVYKFIVLNSGNIVSCALIEFCCKMHQLYNKTFCDLGWMNAFRGGRRQTMANLFLWQVLLLSEFIISNKYCEIKVFF